MGKTKKHKPNTSFNRWYAANKEPFAERRRQRYAEDPVYRERVKAAARAYEKPSRATPPPAEYPYTLQQAGAVLGVAASTVRDWIRKHYLPKPKLFLNRFVFSAKQLDLMESLKDFLATKASKTTVHTDEFKDLIAFITVNWN